MSSIVCQDYSAVSGILLLSVSGILLLANNFNDNEHVMVNVLSYITYPLSKGVAWSEFLTIINVQFSVSP